MPRIRLTKSAIDALPTLASDVVYWDATSPGFGVKVTPKGRKVFLVLYRTGGAGSRLRKYTVGPYGRVTLHQARLAAQKVFSAKVEGRDLAAEKREARRRVVADRVEDLLETFIAQHVSQNRSAGEMSRLLRREVGRPWAGKSIHEITKRDVVEVISAIEQRGAPIAANKTLKSIKTFLRWCVGRAVLDQSPAEGVPLPAKEVARDRVLDDQELAQVILAARKSLDAAQITDKKCQGAPRASVRSVGGCPEPRRPAGTVGLLPAGNQALPRIQSSQILTRSALRSDWVAAA